MSRQPLVSVIVPVFNTEKYLPRCLDSLLRQTYRHIEILAVDDASADASAAVLVAYAARDERIRVFQKKNEGVAAARNLGLRQARGKWVMFCDSDDWVEPDWVQTLVEAVSLPGVDLAVTDCLTEAEEGRNGGRGAEDVKYNCLPCGGKMSFGRALWLMPCMLWNKIFDLERIRRENISFPVVGQHEDFAFLFQYLLLDGALLALPNKATYHYTLRSESLMGRLFHKKHDRHAADYLRACRFVADWLVRRGVWERWSDVFYVRLAGALRFSYKYLPDEKSKERLCVLARDLFTGLPECNRQLPDGLILAVLSHDVSAIRRELERPEEWENGVKAGPFWLMRRISTPYMKKVFVLGVEVYKKEPFYLGGRRFIFGLPLGRRKFK